MGELISDYEVEAGKGLLAMGVAGTILSLAGMVSTVARNTETAVHPLRNIELPLVGHPFEHMGNFIDGALLSTPTIGLSALALAKLSARKERESMNHWAPPVAGFVLAAAVNLYYESGGSIGVFQDDKKWTADKGDAAYGAFSALICASSYYAGAIKAKTGKSMRTRLVTSAMKINASLY